MSYQNNKSNYDMPFCGLSVRIKPTGNQSPKYEFSADASKVKYTCSLTKKKFSLSQINEWYNLPEVKPYFQKGYILKYMAKTNEIQNPHQYDKGNTELVFSLVMVKPYKPRTDNVDGLKPISQAMPQHATQFAPDHAQPVDSMNDMDDEIPF
jgi:hypothetical protein